MTEKFAAILCLECESSRIKGIKSISAFKHVRIQMNQATLLNSKKKNIIDHTTRYSRQRAQNFRTMNQAK